MKLQNQVRKDMKKNLYYFVIERYGREDWYKIEAKGIGIGFCMSKYITVKL